MWSDGSPWSVRQKIKTYKEEAGAKGPSYLWNGMCQWSYRHGNRSSYGNPFRVSELTGRERRKGGDAHLHMSLAESPLYLILLSNVEMGLEGGER